jgi:hypothetical protein
MVVNGGLFTLRRGYLLLVFEKQALMKICGLKGDEVTTK